MTNFIVRFKTGALYLLAAFFGPVLSVLINPLLAENLSHKDYAVIGYFSSFQIILIPIVSFNFNTFFLRHNNSFEEISRQAFINTILLGQVLVGIVATMIFCVAFYIYLILSGDPFVFFPFAFLAFLQTYFSIFLTFYLIKLRVDKKAETFALVSIVSVLIYVFLTLLCVVVFPYGAEGKFSSALLASVAGAVYVIYKGKSGIKIDWQLFKTALKFGLPLTISALFWYFLSGVDKALLASRGGELNYGNYIVAGQISSYMAIFYTAINNLVESDIYKAISENNFKQLKRLMLIVISLVVAVNFIYIIFSDQLISFLTAGRYVASSGFSKILALQNIAMTIYYLAVKLYVGYGMLKEELAVRIVGAGCAFVVLNILIAKFGFYGAAWGQVLSFSFLALLSISVLYFRKRGRNEG